MAEHNKPTSEDKLRISIISALIFIVFASPYFFQLLHKASDKLAGADGCPTMYGVIAAAVAYGIVTRLLMR